LSEVKTTATSTLSKNIDNSLDNNCQQNYNLFDKTNANSKFSSIDDSLKLDNSDSEENQNVICFKSNEMLLDKIESRSENNSPNDKKVN